MSSIPAEVTDWVLVQLRSTADGAAVASKSAFLHKDSRIVDDDGSDQIEMTAPPDDYYIVIKHRNHLAVMSANPVTLSSGSATLYNFTTGSDKFYGTGGGAKEIESGVWGMWSGEIYQDGYVTTQDYTDWYNSARAGDSGYQNPDLNLDAQVTTEDYTIWYNNARAGASSPVP